VLDTCVLAPMPLCDTLLRLAEDPALYLPKWSNDILLELRSTLQHMGYTAGQVQRRITAMETAFGEAKVVGYECLLASMTNHPKDRHVVAAAVRCGADAIRTGNVKHFPTDSVAPYEIEVLTPDQFLVQQLDLNRELVMDRIRRQAEVRGVPMEELLFRLARHAARFTALARSRGASSGLDLQSPGTGSS